jgi:hypothetical protein
MRRTFVRTFSDHKTKATAVATHTGKIDVYWNTPDLNPSIMGEYSAWRADILSELQAPPASRYCAVLDGEGNLVAEIGLTEKPTNPPS